MSRFDGETIWIVGASSGIGAALARCLHERGAALILSARRGAALEELNEALGGKHMVLPFDAGDEAALAAAFGQLEEARAQTGLTINRAVFLAALYEPAPIAKLDAAFTRTLLSVNVWGAMVFSEKMLGLYARQPDGGQIALCGSVAGYMGLPQGQPYSASKAAVRNFAESLAAEAPASVDVKLISPGFVRTRITDKNDFDMPFMIEPEAAAAALARGLKAWGFEIHFPKRFTLQLKLLALLPYWLSLRLTRWLV